MTIRPRRRSRVRVIARAITRAPDRGSGAVQAVVILPLIFTLLFVGMQAALFYWGRTVAIAAAEEGARVSATENGTVSDGVAQAHSFVGDGGSDALQGVSVTGGRSATAATITVSGTVLSVIPGFAPQVTQTATFPLERLTGSAP